MTVRATTGRIIGQVPENTKQAPYNPGAVVAGGGKAKSPGSTRGTDQEQKTQGPQLTFLSASSSVELRSTLATTACVISKACAHAVRLLHPDRTGAPVSLSRRLIVRGHLRAYESVTFENGRQPLVSVTLRFLTGHLTETPLCFCPMSLALQFLGAPC
jgi:hypothetical protein